MNNQNEINILESDSEDSSSRHLQLSMEKSIEEREPQILRLVEDLQKLRENFYTETNLSA